MQFLDVRTDFAFKKVFGSPHSKDLLIDFLNAILDVGDSPIVDLTIVDPYLVPAVAGLKNTFVDVKAQLKDGRHVIIEMQVLNLDAMEKRVLYNAAKAYSTQLQKGHSYSLLMPVIALTITDFVMFPEPELKEVVITYFTLLEKQHFLTYSEAIELVFVELPKFTKPLAQLETLTDKWIYFLKHAGGLEGIPPNLALEPNIQQAFQIASVASLTNAELEVQERKLHWLGVQQELKEQAEAAVLRAERAEHKLREAEQRAQQAAQTTAFQIAKQLLQAEADLTLIQQVTGLELAEIKRLKYSLTTGTRDIGG